MRFRVCCQYYTHYAGACQRCDQCHEWFERLYRVIDEDDPYFRYRRLCWGCTPQNAVIDNPTFTLHRSYCDYVFYGVACAVNEVTCASYPLHPVNIDEMVSVCISVINWCRANRQN